MIDEDKELVLRDLSARLPYGVKVHWNGEHELVKLYRISFYGKNVDEHIVNGLGQPEPGYEFDMHIEDIKPYLRPLSSMTDEDESKWMKVLLNPEYSCSGDDWLLEHHFDIRHLIERGLALEAPQGMYEVQD